MWPGCPAATAASSPSDHVSFDIEPGSITGLLGGNGAGKTTLMRILAGQEFASAGSVTVLGASPVTSDALLHRMVFVREDQRYPDYGWPYFLVRHAVRAASWFYPDWDGGLAEALLGDFGLPPGRAVRQLSRGMRSALGIVIGLAARAEVTLFDEPYAGLDPVARQLFYDRLLADYAAHPRTVLLSTHLIDEAAGLLQRVGQDSPGLSAGLPYIDPARPEREKPVDLPVAVRGAAGEVKMYTVLDRLGIGNRHEAHADRRVLVCRDDDLVVALGEDFPAERLRPEPGQAGQVVSVNDDVVESDGDSDSMRGMLGSISRKPSLFCRMSGVLPDLLR